MLRKIAANPELAIEEGRWIDVVGTMAAPEYDGPVPDVMPALRDRLFGAPSQSIQRGVVFLLGALALVLAVKAGVIGFLLGLW